MADGVHCGSRNISGCGWPGVVARTLARALDRHIAGSKPRVAVVAEKSAAPSFGVMDRFHHSVLTGTNPWQERNSRAVGR